MSRPELVVVGAGVFGSWIAFLAQRRNYSVTLIDQYGPANNRSGSTGETRIIRSAYGPDEIYTVMALRSLQMWTGFLNEHGHPSCFRKTGVLWLAAASDSALAQAQSIFEKHRVPHNWLDAAALSARYPQMSVPPNAAALLEHDAGALMAERSVEAVVEAAVREGVQYTTQRITPPSPTDPRLFVFAAGSWLPALFPDLLHSIIRPTRQELFFFTPPANTHQFESAALPIWVDQTEASIPYGLPDFGAGIKVGFHRLGPAFDADTSCRDITEHQISEAAAYLANRFPAMQAARYQSARVCHYDNTASGDFLIDRHPTQPNVWFAGGGSGHGFKHAPAVAEYLLDAIETGRSPEPRFTLSSKQASATHRVL